MIKMESVQAVALLSRLREGTSSERATLQRFRKSVFYGVTAALKGLGLVDSKTKVLGIYEGIGSNGEHWFMVEEQEEKLLLSGTPVTVKIDVKSHNSQWDRFTAEESLALQDLRVLIGGETWKPESVKELLLQATEVIRLLRSDTGG